MKRRSGRTQLLGLPATEMHGSERSRLTRLKEDRVGDSVRRGHREIGEFWDREMARYQSIEIVPREIFVTGHEAAMVWTINGVTEEGTVSFDGVDVFEFDDAGLINSVRAFWQRRSLQRQLQGLPGVESARQ